MSDEIINLIKQTLEEHSKSMVTQTQCNGKLWGVMRWAVPVLLSLIGGVAGILITLKIDLAGVSVVTDNNQKRIVIIEQSFNHIDKKLDQIIESKK
jgi:hypothetical protein